MVVIYEKSTGKYVKTCKGGVAHLVSEEKEADHIANPNLASLLMDVLRRDYPYLRFVKKEV